jgi:5-methylcytosine-specific restriction endonuclease McrA
MSSDFYRSPFWLSQRKKILERDKYLCVSCGDHASIVDHIKTRPRNLRKVSDEYDRASNLRSLCVKCDNRIKENTNGIRKNKGNLYHDKVDSMGYPVDPNHPSNIGRGF